LLLLAACGGSGEPEERTGRVARVSDGDTIRLADGTRVRLVQIDAPEVRPPECYGAAADRIVRELIPPDTAVRLEFDSDLDRVDRFGRSLAYVFEGEVNVNVELVRRGAAAPYFFGGDRGRYADELLKAARRARAERRGLWAACPGTRLNPDRALASVP
jgi:micrococcal nuclease